MKKLKNLTVIFLSIIITLSVFITASAASSEDENKALLSEYGFTSDYLDGLTDSMIAEMAEPVKETSDPDYMGDYEYLLSRGIPDDFLKGLSKTALSKIRNYIGDNSISDIDCNTQKAPSSDALIKKLSIQLIGKSNASLLGETVCIYWEHELNKPINRNEDFVEASWNGDDFCYDDDTFYAEDYRRNTTEENWTVSDRYSTLSTASQNRIGHWTKLYTTKKQVGGFMLFKLSPTHPIDSNTDCDTNISADYSYAAETNDFSTVIMCIAFILLTLGTLSFIMKHLKKKRK